MAYTSSYMYRTPKEFNQAMKSVWLDTMPAAHQAEGRLLALRAAQIIRRRLDRDKLAIFAIPSTFIPIGKLRRVVVARIKWQGNILGPDPSGDEEVLYDRTENRAMGWHVAQKAKFATRPTKTGYRWLHQKIVGANGGAANHLAQAAGGPAYVPEEYDDDVSQAGTVGFD